MVGDSVDIDSDWELTYAYDASGESPSTLVPRAVASLTNRDVLAIDPLVETLAPESLDALVTDASGPVSVSFVYEDCRVYVDCDVVAVRTQADSEGEGTESTFG